MSLHSDAVAVLGRWPAPTPTQERLRLRYLDVLSAHPDAMSRTCLPDHLTASTLVLSENGSEVLLTLHSKAQRWFQFGGHCEAGDLALGDAAHREAVEESGIDDLILDPTPIHLSEHAVPFCDPGGQVHHLDVRFLAVVDRGTRFAVSQESLAVRWWPVSDLRDPDLIELVELARRRQSRAS